jgi:hypothetical protein
MAAAPKARAIRPAPFAASPIQQITFSSARTNNPPSRSVLTPRSLAAGLRNIDGSNIRFADPLVTEGTRHGLRLLFPSHPPLSTDRP